MQKGTLTKWGQAMTSISLLACSGFSGLTVTIYAAVLAVANAPSIRQTFPDDPLQIIWLLIKGGLLVAIAIIILTGIFKAVTYSLGLVLIKLDGFIFGEKPAKINMVGKIVQLGERKEFYIKVRNLSLSKIDEVGVSVLQQIKLEDGNYMSTGLFIKWSGQRSHSSPVSIKGLKSKTLHFATIDEEKHILIHTQRGSIPVHPNPNGNKFSLTAYVTIPKTSKQKSKDLDITIAIDEDNRVRFKIKETRGTQRYFLE